MQGLFLAVGFTNVRGEERYDTDVHFQGQALDLHQRPDFHAYDVWAHTHAVATIARDLLNVEVTTDDPLLTLTHPILSKLSMPGEHDDPESALRSRIYDRSRQLFSDLFAGLSEGDTAALVIGAVLHDVEKFLAARISSRETAEYIGNKVDKYDNLLLTHLEGFELPDSYDDVPGIETIDDESKKSLWYITFLETEKVISTNLARRMIENHIAYLPITVNIKKGVNLPNDMSREQHAAGLFLAVCDELGKGYGDFAEIDGASQARIAKLERLESLITNFN